MYLNFKIEEIPAVKGEVEIELTKSEFEGLFGSISAEANHVKARKVALELDDITSMLERYIHPTCFVTTF